MPVEFSVIVPIYNAEKTLSRCIDSIVNQRDSNCELILVNDGSTDRSDSICKKYAREYQKIRYILKENGGVSSARNAGLQQAEGEYVLFVDSDDYVSENCFSVLSEIRREYGPDLILFGAQASGMTERRWITGNYYEDSELGISEIIALALEKYLFSSVCAKAFKTSILVSKGFQFSPNLAIGEDQLFLFTYAMHIRSIASTEKVGYFVDVSNEDSLSRKRREYLTPQLMEVNRKMYQAFGSVEHSPEAARNYKAALAWVAYRSAYSCCKELLKFEYTAKQRRQEIRRICKLYCDEGIEAIGFRCRIMSMPIRYRLAGLVDEMTKAAAKK